MAIIVYRDREYKKKTARLILEFQRREEVYAKQTVMVGLELSQEVQRMNAKFETRLHNLKVAITNYGVVEYSKKQNCVASISLQFSDITGYELRNLGENWFINMATESHREKAEILYNGWLSDQFENKYSPINVIDNKGKVHNIRVVALPLYNDEGTVEGFQVFFNDITELEELKLSNDYHKQLVSKLRNATIRSSAYNKALKKIRTVED
jgi:PAS domain S-box-containing protein